MAGTKRTQLGPSVHRRQFGRVGEKIDQGMGQLLQIAEGLVVRLEDLEKIVKPGPGPKPPGPGPQPGPDDSVYLLQQREFYGDILVARNEGDYERAVALLDELRTARVDDPIFQKPVFQCVRGTTELMADWLGESLRSLYAAIDPDVPDAVASATMRNMACVSMRMGCHEEALEYAQGYVAPEEMTHLGVTTLFN